MKEFLAWMDKGGGGLENWTIFMDVIYVSSLKEENYFSFLFNLNIFVIMFYAVNTNLLFLQIAHCSYLLFFLGLFLWYLIFLNHLRWLYEVNHF